MKPILVNISDEIATISFNRPHVRNAFDHEALVLLNEALIEVGGDPQVKCVILTGEGDTFCSGDDLNEASTIDDEQHEVLLELVQNLTLLMRNMPKPVIAAIDGFAVGGGLEMTFACDIRIATARAKFGTPEVKHALLISNATSVLLPTLIGDGNAREMLYTARLMDADWAYRVGLINEIVPNNQLKERARTLASQIVGVSTPALAWTKQLLNAATDEAVNKAIESEADMVRNTSIIDSREHIQDFFQATK